MRVALCIFAILAVCHAKSIEKGNPSVTLTVLPLSELIMSGP